MASKRMQIDDTHVYQQMRLSFTMYFLLSIQKLNKILLRSIAINRTHESMRLISFLLIFVRPNSLWRGLGHLISVSYFSSCIHCVRMNWQKTENKIAFCCTGQCQKASIIARNKFKISDEKSKQNEIKYLKWHYH